MFVCGTDTDAGKTVTSAALMRRYRHLRHKYWKPVQTGADNDTGTVQSIAELGSRRFIKPLYSFHEPLSPHRAGELDGVEIDLSLIVETFRELSSEGPLLLEGAGGLFVPLNRKFTWADFLQKTALPVILAARSGLGTINHSLLTVRALESMGIPLAGIVFNGPINPDNRQTVSDFTGCKNVLSLDYRSTADLDEFDPDGVFEKYLGGL